MLSSDFSKIANQQGRDRARTPIQWNCSNEAGVTSGEQWMPLNSNFKQIDKGEQDSVLSYYRNMIRIRKTHPVLIYGSYQSVETESEKRFVYIRENEEEKMLIAFNFYKETVNLHSRFISKIQKKLIGIYPPLTHEWMILRPWEASVYTLNT